MNIIHRCLPVFLAVLCLVPTCSAQSRDRKRAADRPSPAALEIRLKKAEEALVKEYRDVAVEFYEQGDREKSMQMLRRLKELNPKLEGLDQQIETISEELLQDNADDFDLDTRKSWELVGQVAEGKPFRVAAEGDYKLTYSTTVSAAGLVTPQDKKNVSPDYLPAAPLGCLLGVIVIDGKPGKPFPIREALEHKPKKSGQLYIKVNVPPGTRCIGRLKIKVSGYVARPSRR